MTTTRANTHSPALFARCAVRRLVAIDAALEAIAAGTEDAAARRLLLDGLVALRTGADTFEVPAVGRLTEILERVARALVWHEARASKAMVTLLRRGCGTLADVVVDPVAHPALHPTRCRRLERATERALAGWYRA